MLSSGNHNPTLSTGKLSEICLAVIRKELFKTFAARIVLQSSSSVSLDVRSEYICVLAEFAKEALKWFMTMFILLTCLSVRWQKSLTSWANKSDLRNYLFMYLFISSRSYSAAITLND